MTQMLTALLFSLSGMFAGAIMVAMVRANAGPILRALLGEGAFAPTVEPTATLRPVRVLNVATVRPINRPISVPRFEDWALRAAA
jgi:hypothetical protein